jgi:hypothetical protein
VKANKTLVLLFFLNVAASLAHYTDNIIRFVVYPEPPWLNPTRVDAFWFVMTPFGAAAVWLHARGRKRLAFALNYAYGAMGLLVLGHYLTAPPWRLSASINALIVLEAIAAAWLLGGTVRLHREHLCGEVHATERVRATPTASPSGPSR